MSYVRATVALTTLWLLLALGVVPAAVAAGGGSERPGGCRLERIERQLVRCDDLTGNGVRAPLHVPLQARVPVATAVAAATRPQAVLQDHWTRVASPRSAPALDDHWTRLQQSTTAPDQPAHHVNAGLR